MNDNITKKHFFPNMKFNKFNKKFIKSHIRSHKALKNSKICSLQLFFVYLNSNLIKTIDDIIKTCIFRKINNLF